jgi:hypothetical protein
MDLELERKRLEFEAALEITMNAVLEQYVQPLTHALGILTFAISHQMDGEWLAEQLQGQAETCPTDVAGKGILYLLADMARLPGSTPPGDVCKRANISLKVLRGGKK